ncbi:hypothetical protein [Parasporobacterium paucivorans]|uniref:Zinc ribbon domain-containing protein n=1 Tax=Parasporobacterium paucivorans DSM 15970 TaxID=1122934 RepID=A0A1M6B3Y2_9FIRM|nr:hypothetical protein [Parasporobacterium paucivorans]SHI43415.1 hypothetical protein SAMN02745691_00253 [Parasporobacterium paucivorans DSM 15970]
MNKQEIIEMIQKTESATFRIDGLGETTIATKELKFLIEAREKQIPKSVIWTPSHQSYFSAGDEAEPLCPSCGDVLEDDQRICLECYQILKWEGKE